MKINIFKIYQPAILLNFTDTILKKTGSDDTMVFSNIVNQCQQMVYNTALGIVQNMADAEDITQEVFIEVFRSLKSFRHQSTLSTWIYRITINRSLDHEKKKKRQKNGGFLKRIFDIKDEEPASFDHPGVTLDNKENARVLFRAIGQLPEKQRLVFLLNKLEGLSFEEIATIMDVSVTAAESAAARAKANLKNTLQDYYDKHFK